MGNFRDEKMTKKSTEPRATKTENEACIINSVLYVGGLRKAHIDDPSFSVEIERLKAIRVVSMDDAKTHIDFINGVRIDVKIDYQITLRSEMRSGKKHWYAYRRAYGKLNKRYVGYSEGLNSERLYWLCRDMPTSR